jgi:hypothetical protein
MTSDREALREKVKEIIAIGCGCDRSCGDRMSVLDCSCLNDADAAIDVVLEEAARVADAEASIEGIAQRIAAAIRAMKGKATSPESGAPDADQSPATQWNGTFRATQE